jgi:hypothetical protein
MLAQLERTGPHRRPREADGDGTVERMAAEVAALALTCGAQSLKPIAIAAQAVAHAALAKVAAATARRGGPARGFCRSGSGRSSGGGSHVG